MTKTFLNQQNKNTNFTGKTTAFTGTFSYQFVMQFQNIVAFLRGFLTGGNTGNYALTTSVSFSLMLK